MTSSHGGAIERRDLLLTLSEELNGLGASAASLQATLGQILEAAAGAGQAAAELWHMQEIDRLQQTLEDLAAILMCAAVHDGQHFDVERLVAETRLGALRDRLRGSTAEAAVSQQAGVVAIF